MKLVVQVKLLPTPVQAAALEATLCACNRAADQASRVAYETGVTSRNDLQKAVYADLKTRYALSAQPVVRVVKKVVDAYATLRANLKTGRLGPADSKRYRKATGSPIAFRPQAAQPFDDRCLSWQMDARTVSVWTVHGRLKNVGFAASPDQLKTLVAYRKGESDLIFRDGKWFLAATCEIPDPEVFEPVDWIGVDRGIVNLATTSDNTNYQGRRLSRYRRWQARKRAELQARKTRSATRRLARRAKREHRHATHMNHVISKEIVSVAQRTGRGMAVEELGGPGPGTATPGPARHALCLAFPPVGTAPRLQGPPGRGAVPRSGSGLYLAALSALWAHRSGQPARPGPFPLSSVRARWPRRPRRRGQRARSRTLGVGIRHHARRSRAHPGLKRDATRDRPVVGGSRERDKA
ncbi:transposase [Streptomyces violaceusniger]|uniref:Transposase IS891/IS1136/IS1341 family n=1 Tax=Streptomyces violaceusniger (strain Tu 4113) TaxID=653045 RepID=G2PDM8_STRV4|nr:transposase IS891/IS1136/IS1341 family [Streptomyces violaceusniger Tu 4113]